MMKTIFTGALVSLCLAVSGCASKNDLGYRIASNSEAATDISEDYKEAERMIAQGEKKLKSGRNQVDQGEQNIRDGERLIADGEDLMAKAKIRYCEQIGFSDASC